MSTLPALPSEQLAATVPFPLCDPSRLHYRLTAAKQQLCAFRKGGQTCTAKALDP